MMCNEAHFHLTVVPVVPVVIPVSIDYTLMITTNKQMDPYTLNSVNTTFRRAYVTH